MDHIRPSAQIKTGINKRSSHTWLATGNDTGYKLSWGQPAKVCQAIVDKDCPACGAECRDVQYDGTRLIAGFECDGKDGLCGECGFAFTTSVDEIVTPAEDAKKSKQGCRAGKRDTAKRNRKRRKQQ